jgi:signal transduction histidine kinase
MVAGLVTAQTRRRAYTTLLVLLALVGLGGWTLVHYEVQRIQDSSDEASFRLAVAGAHAATHGVQRTLEAVTSMHELAASLALTYAETGSTERRLVEGILTEVAAAERFGIVQVALIGPHGWLTWSTVPSFTPVDLSDREHFRVHRDGQRDTFVSAPLVGRASMRWSIQVSARILTASGDFAGVAVVSLDPIALSESLAELRFTEGVTINLLRDDGVILARSQDAGRYLGELRGGADLERINASVAGQLLTEGPLSGRPIYLAWRRLLGWPVAVTFAIDAKAAMQDMARQRQDLYLLLGALLAFIAVTGLFITEWQARRAARGALDQAEEARERVGRLLDALPGAAYRGYVAPDGDMTRLHLSPAIARITGWPEEKFDRPGSFTAIIEEEFRKLRRHFYVNIIQTGQDVMEYPVLAGNGEAVWVRDDCHVVSRLPDGRVEVVGMITDITAERLLKAQALASAKLATLGEMAAGVAHELNQPCAAITLAADLAALEVSRGGAERLASAQKRLDEIARQTVRMRDIIDQFRIFARTDEGAESAVDLGEVVRGAITIVGGTLRASGVRIETTMPDGLPLVRGRVVALEQVLVNLLVNARDAMDQTPTAERRVEILGRPAPEADAVILELRDHGPGIPPEVQSRLFEPFFTTKPVGKGTGLGLALAYGTIQGFGGSITIENHPEGGALAQIRLPLAA